MALRDHDIKDLINQKYSSRSAADPDEIFQKRDISGEICYKTPNFLGDDTNNNDALLAPHAGARKTTTDVIALTEMKKILDRKRQKIALENIVVEEKNNLRKVDSGSYSSKQLASTDLNKRFKNNPAMVTEYLTDIFSHLRSLEIKFLIEKGFLKGHRTTPVMRSKLVNWLVKVHMLFGFYIETLHLCIAIVDRYLQKNKNVGDSKLQLVGISALLIATKYEEIYPLQLKDYEYPYSQQQILEMELKILKDLDFSLGRPLPITFLRAFNRIARSQRDHRYLGSYMLELALSSHEMSHVRPSLQAAAVCCLSIGILNDIIDLSTIWTPKLVRFTKYEYSDLQEVLVILAINLLVSSTSKFETIREKYAKSTYGEISLNSKLNGPLVQKLATKCFSYNHPATDPVSGFLTKLKYYYKKCLCVSTSR